MRVTPVPLLAFASVFVGTAVALWVSFAWELVPRCNVYVDGCISISAAGRHPPAVHFFRGFVVPHAVLLMLLWHLTAPWLDRLAAVSPRRRRIIAASGTISPVFLIYYVVVLGAEGAFIEDTRLIAVRIFFVATLLAQLLTSMALLRQARERGGPVPARLALAMLVTCIAASTAAALSVPIQLFVPEPSALLNLMQWYASSIFIVWFLLLWPAWRHTGFSVRMELSWSGASEFAGRTPAGTPDGPDAAHAQLSDGHLESSTQRRD